MTEDVFLVQLSKGLESYKIKIENNAIPRLKQAASIMHSSFKNIYQILLDKKFLDADQYKDDTNITEIKAPSSESFIESEKKIEMSIRIAAYSKQLDFLNTNFRFNLENLSLGTIKKLADLLKFIDWISFSENSIKIITRNLASMMGTIKLGNDQMQLKVVKNDLKRMREETQSFMEALKNIAFLRKEQYKAELRKKVSFDSVINYKEDSKEDIEKNIRHLIAKDPNKIPIFKDIIFQLIEEERNAPKSWEKLLKTLTPSETKTVTTKGLDKRQLLKIVQELGKASLILSKIVKKFDENTVTLNKKKRNIFEKLAYMISQSFNKNKKIIYNIQVFNETNTVKKTVTLNYISFTDKLKKNAHDIYLLSTPDNLKRLMSLEDDEILIKINSSLDIFKRSIRKLNALDTYFKEEAPQNVKSEISGIKVELKAIQFALANSNKCRNNYISQKEEIEQLKKLGINVESS